MITVSAAVQTGWQAAAFKERGKKLKIFRFSKFLGRAGRSVNSFQFRHPETRDKLAVDRQFADIHRRHIHLCTDHIDFYYTYIVGVRVERRRFCICYDI